MYTKLFLYFLNQNETLPPFYHVFIIFVWEQTTYLFMYL